ncbi:sigma-54-dependent transcriptional regulator [Polycyclovorans algicola]|uniref:sigma-54-dependent transcriptional regulator n=1 Tax=Polycyclovorans algicola TaxID=616992 RepID=UPI0004A6D6A1|nr:sigma-54 dependent transcriptional regulator [Polycyclovorans algicola]
MPSSTPARRVLIVDDEADLCELLEITLSRMGLQTRAVGSVAAARAQLAEQAFDFCITDMRLPDGSGLDLVHHLHGHYPDLPVAVITAHGNTELAVESLKAGAFDFVSKPVDLSVLRRLVHDALALCPQGAAPDTEDPTLLGTHPSMVALRALVQRLGRSQAPVHISGESGTGKELVARQIHRCSARAKAPFVPVNCGAIPPDLMESEFFGHLKGAFTGAVRDKAGFFQAAEGGTLFLDEVADLPLAMQVKLLRALQERQVRPVGAELEQPVNVRIISATHQRLDEAVQRGHFRQDLYYRLNVIEVHAPALRDHAQDIPALVEHGLALLTARHGLPQVPAVTRAALDALCAYPFPGNVRELENILERALTLSDGGAIDAHDLQLRPATLSARAAPTATKPEPEAMVAEDASLGDQVEAIERRAIVDALQRARFNKTRAAALLGMSFRALRYRIKKLKIDA